MSRTARVPRSAIRRSWPALVGAMLLLWAAPAGAAPFVYVTDAPFGFGVGKVSEFDATAGKLGLAADPVFAGANPAGVAVTPDGTSVYVTNVSDNTVSQYDVATDGTLSAKSPSTVAAGNAPVGIAVNPDGNGVYVTNANDDTVSQYDIGPGGTLTSAIPATVPTGHNPQGVAVSPDGKTVYVAGGTFGRGVLSQYDVGAGEALTPKTPAAVTTGRSPSAIAVSPDGESVYVTDLGDNTISQYDIAAGGALSVKTPATVATGSGPHAIAVSPDSQSVYVADSLDGLLAEYTASGGGLAVKTPTTIAAGTNPSGVVVSPDGKSVYATDFSTGPGVVLQYNGGSGPGTLVAKTPASVPAGNGPNGIAIGPAHLRFTCASALIACSAHILFVGRSRNSVQIFSTHVRPGPVGILVERIVGKRRVRAGRVPFGPQPTGRLRLRWDLRVNGHKLPKGRYLITLRAFDHHGYLIALARPVEITVR